MPAKKKKEAPEGSAQPSGEPEKRKSLKESIDAKRVEIEDRQKISESLQQGLADAQKKLGELLETKKGLEGYIQERVRKLRKGLAGSADTDTFLEEAYKLSSENKEAWSENDKKIIAMQAMIADIREESAENAKEIKKLENDIHEYECDQATRAVVNILGKWIQSSKEAFEGFDALCQAIRQCYARENEDWKLRLQKANTDPFFTFLLEYLRPSTLDEVSMLDVVSDCEKIYRYESNPFYQKGSKRRSTEQIKAFHDKAEFTPGFMYR